MIDSLQVPYLPAGHLMHRMLHHFSPELCISTYVDPNPVSTNMTILLQP